MKKGHEWDIYNKKVYEDPLLALSRTRVFLSIITSLVRDGKNDDAERCLADAKRHVEKSWAALRKRHLNSLGKEGDEHDGSIQCQVEGPAGPPV